MPTRHGGCLRKNGRTLCLPRGPRDLDAARSGRPPVLLETLGTSGGGSHGCWSPSCFLKQWRRGRDLKIAFGIATVPILAAVNPAPGANIGIEIEIMATGTAIEAHTTAPAARTALR
jgi:hypothetical protein